MLAEIDNALDHHELIKVKVAGADRETKQLIIDAILRETKAVEVQTIGHILVLYRQSEEKKSACQKQLKRSNCKICLIQPLVFKRFFIGLSMFKNSLFIPLQCCSFLW